MMLNNKSRHTPAITMNSFSGQSKYTETFFHYPSKNPHSTSSYEAHLSNRPIKTFRNKGKSQFHTLMYTSSLNPFTRNQQHYEPHSKVTGDRKRKIAPFSTKQTDPITLTHEPKWPQNKVAKDHQATIDYKKDIERKHYLPIDREFSKAKRNYHSQLGFSLSAGQCVTPRPGLNESKALRSTIQYTEHSEMNRPCFFDDFKYSSRK